MKITDVKIMRLSAILTTEDYSKCYTLRPDCRRTFPSDVIEGYVPDGDNISIGPYITSDGTQWLSHLFLAIETDAEITGYAGPIANPIVARYLSRYKKILIGEDPTANERIWLMLFSINTNNYAGEGMEAISYIDLALWDIKCKKYHEPLWKLLGGPIRKTIPAYANMAGMSYNLTEVIECVKYYCKTLGYRAMKWYPQFGPTDGTFGIEGNRKLFETIRLSAGSDVQIMIDSWSSWGKDYTYRMMNVLEEYNIEWIEEPVFPLQDEAYKAIKQYGKIKIAAGENIRTRWGFRQMVTNETVDIYMPDPAWCGGITELLKILSFLNVCDKTVSLHNSIPPLGVSISAAYPITFIPLAEYLVSIGWMSQYFYSIKTEPINGEFRLSEIPGIGTELDMNKVDSIEILE